MTIVKGIVTMSGSLGNVTFYTRRGSDKVIMRAKGGVTRKGMAANPKYEVLRKHQKEFGGCSGFGKYARNAFGELCRVADYNLSAVLTGIGRNLMKLDTTSEVGKRNLYLSRNKEALEGFNFNRTNPFTSVLRVIPRVDLDRAKVTGAVTIPRINTETDLMNYRKMPFFRILVSIGALADLVYNPATGSYEPMGVEMNGISRILTGEWHSTQTILSEQTLTVVLPEERIAFLTDNVSVLLCMAVEFGNVGSAGEPVEVKYAGCGKVVKVG